MALFRKTTVETIIEPIGGIVKQLHKHAAAHHRKADDHESWANHWKIKADAFREEANKASGRAEHYTKLFNL